MTARIDWIDGQSVAAADLNSLGEVINNKLDAFTHATALSSQFLQLDSGRIFCGVYKNGAAAKYWAYNSSTAYQQDSLTDLNTYVSMSLPTNIVTNHGIRIVAPGPSQPGAGYMYLLGYNSSTAVFELYRAALVTKGTSPTWSAKLLSLQANAILIGSNLRATASGIFVGEYTGGSDISAGPNVYRSTDGTTFTTVLDLLGTGAGWTRHVHGIFEDTFTGDIYVTVGDSFSPYSPAHFVYRSTNGGASFSGVTSLDPASGQWQCVSMGFTADYIFFASDQTQGGGAYCCDRATMTPRWVSLLKHDKIAVPGGGGRSVVTLATNSNTTIGLTSPEVFTSADVGRMIGGPNEIADGTYITAVGSSSSATLSVAAAGTNTGDVATISDSFFVNAFMGAVDPATGYFYVFAVDTSSPGNTGGLFVYTEPGAPPILLHTIRNMSAASINSQELMILNGLAWIGRFFFTLPTP